LMFLVTISCLRCVVVIVIDVGVASKREIRTGEQATAASSKIR
jgi:hypothetical protein